MGGIGRQAEAVEHMKKIREKERIQEKEKALYLEAAIFKDNYYTDLGVFDQARQIFQDLSQEFPENGFLHYGLGENLFFLKDYRGAIEEK